MAELEFKPRQPGSVIVSRHCPRGTENVRGDSGRSVWREDHSGAPETKCWAAELRGFSCWAQHRQALGPSPGGPVAGGSLILARPVAFCAFVHPERGARNRLKWCPQTMAAASHPMFFTHCHISLLVMGLNLGGPGWHFTCHSNPYSTVDWRGAWITQPVAPSVWLAGWPRRGSP